MSILFTLKGELDGWMIVDALVRKLRGFEAKRHKNYVAKTLLRRADCLPSSLDSKTEERKYVFNVLQANGYPKNFLCNFNKPFTTSSTPDEREPATGFAVIPYIQVLRNPSREFLTTTTLKLLKNLFRRTGAIYSIP